jgi:hypothetical protein
MPMLVGGSTPYFKIFGFFIAYYIKIESIMHWNITSDYYGTLTLYISLV